MDRKPAVLEHLLQIRQHSLADSGNFQHFFRLADQVGNLLRHGFNRLGCIAIGTDAEGILPVNFQQVGGFVEDARDGLVVHVLHVKIKQDWSEEKD